VPKVDLLVSHIAQLELRRHDNLLVVGVQEHVILKRDATHRTAAPQFGLETLFRLVFDEGDLAIRQDAMEQ
jgi:hypothetical protein